MSIYKSIWPAIATCDLESDDEVGLYMENGLLFADKKSENYGARAIVINDALVNEDVALRSLTGTIDLETGQIVIITLPTIKEGGSNAADLDLIENIHSSGLKKWGLDRKFDKVAVLGTVSHVVANKLNLPVDIEFAIAQSSISATKKGLNILILSVGNMTKSIIKVFENDDVKYNIIDAHLI
jgi:putative transcriptional regulator